MPMEGGDTPVDSPVPRMTRSNRRLRELIAARRRRKVREAITLLGVVAAGSLAVLLAAQTDAQTTQTTQPSPAEGYSTLFAVAAHPTVITPDYDSLSVELGVQFRTQVDGSIAGMRLYRARGESAAHPARLWDAQKHVIATATFAGSTSYGWQYVKFDKPVAVHAGQTYVASYHAKGAYAAQQNYFSQATVSTAAAQLAALRDSGTSRNGVYTYGTAAAYPTSTWRASNYWIDVLFKSGSGAGSTTTAKPTSSTAKPSTTTAQPTSTTAKPTSTTAKPTTTTAAPTSTSAKPTSTSPAPGGTSYVLPGTVGYLGSTSALTSYSPGGAAPAGCQWFAAGLNCSSSTLSLDHVYIHGGIYFSGSGNATVTNSIIEGGAGSEWTDFYAASASSSATITVRNSTLRWAPGKKFPSGYDTAPIWTRGNQALVVENCDLSGLPQGLDPGGNSVVRNNWIHDLVQNSTDPNNPTHLDGVFSQGGNNITITGNYIDIPRTGAVNAAVFLQQIPSKPMTGIVISGNFLRGGAYTFRNESGQGVVVTNNVFGGAIYGDAINTDIGTIATWSGNVRADGSTVPKP